MEGQACLPRAWEANVEPESSRGAGSPPLLMMRWPLPALRSLPGAAGASDHRPRGLKDTGGLSPSAGQKWVSLGRVRVSQGWFPLEAPEENRSCAFSSFSRRPLPWLVGPCHSTSVVTSPPVTLTSCLPLRRPLSLHRTHPENPGPSPVSRCSHSLHAIHHITGTLARLASPLPPVVSGMLTATKQAGVSRGETRAQRGGVPFPGPTARIWRDGAHLALVLPLPPWNGPASPHGTSRALHLPSRGPPRKDRARPDTGHPRGPQSKLAPWKGTAALGNSHSSSPSPGVENKVPLSSRGSSEEHPREDSVSVTTGLAGAAAESRGEPMCRAEKSQKPLWHCAPGKQRPAPEEACSLVYFHFCN